MARNAHDVRFTPDNGHRPAHEILVFAQQHLKCIFLSRIIRFEKLPLVSRDFRKRAITGHRSKRINLATKCQIISFGGPRGREILGQWLSAFGGKADNGGF
jgi:hypothetical protein